MPSSKKPRKAYRPRRLLHIPVTGGLVAMFRETLEAGEIGLLAAKNETGFNALSTVLDVIAQSWAATLDAKSRDADHERDPEFVQIASGLHALRSIMERYERIGRVEVSRSGSEAQPIVNACAAALRVLPRMSVETIYVQHKYWEAQFVKTNGRALERTLVAV